MFSCAESWHFGPSLRCDLWLKHDLGCLTAEPHLQHQSTMLLQRRNQKRGRCAYCLPMLSERGDGDNVEIGRILGEQLRRLRYHLYISLLFVNSLYIIFAVYGTCVQDFLGDITPKDGLRRVIFLKQLDVSGIYLEVGETKNNSCMHARCIHHTLHICCLASLCVDVDVLELARGMDAAKSREALTLCWRKLWYWVEKNRPEDSDEAKHWKGHVFTFFSRWFISRTFDA